MKFLPFEGDQQYGDNAFTDGQCVEDHHAHTLVAKQKAIIEQMRRNRLWTASARGAQASAECIYRVQWRHACQVSYESSPDE
jgi:hypothetical protein